MEVLQGFPSSAKAMELQAGQVGGGRSHRRFLRLLPGSSVLIILVSHRPQSLSLPDQDFAGGGEPGGDAGEPCGAGSGSLEEEEAKDELLLCLRVSLAHGLCSLRRGKPPTLG